MKQHDVPRTLPTLTEAQRDRLLRFQELAIGFNQRLNLYSEASTEQFWQRHVLHSLTLTLRPFPPGSLVVDWGTGGGLPGLPLAVVFPETEFVLVDSVEKKVRAVQTMARRLGLENVAVWHGRAEEWGGRVTHSVSRATAPLATLWRWHSRVVKPMEETGPDLWPSGLYCLKGGELNDEIAALSHEVPGLEVQRIPLSEIYTDLFFATKELVGVTTRKS